MIFATVYIHVHYVADVLAGALLVLLVLPGAPVLARMLGAPRPAMGARSGLPGARQG